MPLASIGQTFACLHTSDSPKHAANLTADEHITELPRWWVDAVGKRPKAKSDDAATLAQIHFGEGPVEARSSAKTAAASGIQSSQPADGTWRRPSGLSSHATASHMGHNEGSGRLRDGCGSSGPAATTDPEVRLNGFGWLWMAFAHVMCA